MKVEDSTPILSSSPLPIQRANVDIKYLDIPVSDFTRPKETHAVIRSNGTEYHYIFNYNYWQKPRTDPKTDTPLFIRTFYSQKQKEQVWELLKTQPVHKVFNLCGERIPLGINRLREESQQ